MQDWGRCQPHIIKQTQPCLFANNSFGHHLGEIHPRFLKYKYLKTTLNKSFRQKGSRWRLVLPAEPLGPAALQWVLIKIESPHKMKCQPKGNLNSELSEMLNSCCSSLHQTDLSWLVGISYLKTLHGLQEDFNSFCNHSFPSIPGG